jgi:hypothetical protein
MGAFLRNHVGPIAANDCLTAPTATIRALFVFAVLPDERLTIARFAIIEMQSNFWTRPSIGEGVPVRDTA